MTGLNNLQTRLQYKGGIRQLDRMKDSKVKTLKKALLYSYQSQTAILNDGREFRCLINKDKTKISADDKIISIPFEDICLNEQELAGIQIGQYKTLEGTQVIGMKPGDVFTWKETNTNWLVYLQRLEETAYFRAEIRNCRYELAIGNGDNGKTYKVYARKKSLDEIPWRTVKEISWNELDYSLELYITKDDITKDYFHRFDIIELNDKPWEVQAVDAISVEGIVMVALKEYYSNTIADKIKAEKIEKEESQEPEISAITGDTEVYPYDIKQYSIEGLSGGTWVINSTKAKIKTQNDTTATIEIISGRSGEFDLKYVINDADAAVLHIIIKSL